MREAVQGYRRLAFADALDGARAALAAAGIECRVEGARRRSSRPRSRTCSPGRCARRRTNVVRHSGAHACAIRFSSADGGVALQVDDDGTAAAARRRPRATARASPGWPSARAGCDGTLEAGARPGGGFRLRLAVPLAAA